MDSTPNGTEPRIDPTPNGLNPEWTEPRMDWTPNGLNPERTQPRTDSTPNGLNPEWTELRLDWTRIRQNSEWTELRMGHRTDLTLKGTQPLMDWTQNGTQHRIHRLNPEWDSKQNRLDPDCDSTPDGLNSEWGTFQPRIPSQPRMAHNFNSGTKIIFCYSCGNYILLYSLLISILLIYTPWYKFKENSKIIYLDGALTGLDPSRGWVPVRIESIRGWVSVGDESIRDWVPVGIESFRGWVHSELSSFGVVSLRGWVHLRLGSVGESLYNIHPQHGSKFLPFLSFSIWCRLLKGTVSWEFLIYF